MLKRSKHVFTKTKEKICRIVIRPTTTYVNETWVLTKSNGKRMKS